MKQYTFKTITFGVLALFALAPLAQAQVSAGLAITGDPQVTSVKTGGYSVTVKGDDDDEREDDDRKMEDDDRDEDDIAKEMNELAKHLEEKERERSKEEDEALRHLQLRLEEKDLKEDERNASATGTAVVTRVREAKSVRNEEDLKNFVRTKASEDESIKNVEVIDGAVDVSYDEPAELFGFINTTVATHVTVDAKGDVRVTYPWYHIFMKKHAARESIQSDIARALAAESKATREGMASTTQAMIAEGLGIPNIFEIIANTLKSARMTGEAAM